MNTRPITQRVSGAVVLVTSASRGLGLELSGVISGGVLASTGGWDRKIRRESIMKSTFDEALDCLRGTGSEVAGGVAPNHGPMAAEALVALGRDDDVVAWARRYRRRLDAMP